MNRWVYRISQYFFLLLAKVLFRLELHHVERVPRSGFVMVSNHASNLDPMLVGIGLKTEMHFLAKKELFDIPLIGPWIRIVGGYPIHRERVDRKALSSCIQALRKGEPLAVFPEGTRTRDGDLQSGKPGVAMIVAQGKAPCVPAYIQGSYDALPRGASRLKLKKVHVWYGHPFDLPEREEDEPTKVFYQRCADLIMQHIQALKDEAEGKAAQ